MTTRAKYDQKRRQIISWRRFIRMKDKSKALPELLPILPICLAYQVFDSNGEYQGTTQTLKEAEDLQLSGKIEAIHNLHGPTRPIPLKYEKYMT